MLKEALEVWADKVSINLFGNLNCLLISSYLLNIEEIKWFKVYITVFVENY